MESKLPSSVYQKIAQVMSDIGAIKPDKKHTQGYMYRSADHVFNVIQQSMIKRGLVVLSEAQHADYMEDGRYLVSYRFTFVDPDTGDSHACAWLGEAVHTFYKFDQNGKMTGRTINDRAINQSATNALKYFLLKTFVVSDQDPEIDEHDDIIIPTGKKTEPTTNGKSTTTQKSGAGDKTIIKGWATIKTVDYLLGAARNTYPSLSQSEFIKAAGITSYTAYDQWNQKYATGADASKAIKHALEAEPVTPSISPLPVNGEGPGVGSKKSAFSKANGTSTTPLPVNGEGPVESMANEILDIVKVCYNPTHQGRGKRFGVAYTEEKLAIDIWIPEDVKFFEAIGYNLDVWQLQSGAEYKDAFVLPEPIAIITQAKNAHRIDIAASLELHGITQELAA